MASMRDIKRRRTSIQSTQQITKAMKLVSSVKLQRAKARAEKSKSYLTACMIRLSPSLQKSGGSDILILKGRSEGKAVVVITSNRGLAGGYNSNVVKLITRKEIFQG